MLAEIPAEEREVAPAVERKPRPRRQVHPESVYKENGVYVVESDVLERLAALADTRDQRVILQLWREMRRRGLAQRLTDAGIEAGDTIRIGKVEVEWF